MTANIDILPTFIELCGLDGADEGEFDGRSLVPLLRNDGGRNGSAATKAVDKEAASAEGYYAWPERAIVTDTQRLPRPIKWRRSAVMTDRWRLVNGEELYAVKEDTEQRRDLAAEHPDVVAELRTAYEAWWKKVSRQFEEKIPIAIGGPGGVQSSTQYIRLAQLPQ